MYQLALENIKFSHEELVRTAIDTLRHYEPLALQHDPVNGYNLCFSGGKDSECIKRLAIMAGVKFKAFYSNPTIDPPELIAHLRKHHSEVTFIKPKQALLKRVKEKGLPTRLRRWCCAEYKEQSRPGVVKVLGIRAAESKKRADSWQILTKWFGKGGGYCVNPILYWPDQDVWQFIKENNIPYCKLYDEGFKRLGCIGCPMGGKNRITEFARWPVHGRAWERAAVEHWEEKHDKLNRHGELYAVSRFKSGEEMFAWWLSDNPSPKDNGCQMGLF